jgi:hypothetical protein
MQNKFQPKRGDVNALTHDERHILETKVIPTAERWMREYPTDSNMWSHARQTLDYWGRLSSAAMAAE